MISLLAIKNVYDGLETVLSTTRAINEFKGGLLQKKLKTFLIELLSEDVNFAEMAFINLRNEVSEEYFNEALFNAIVNSDSSLRAKLLGIAVRLCAKGEISANAFWSIQKVLSDLTMADLKSIPSLIGHFGQYLESSESDSVHAGSILDSKEFRKVFPHDRVLRLQSVGLVNIDSATGVIERISSKSMLYSVVKVIRVGEV